MSSDLHELCYQKLNMSKKILKDEKKVRVMSIFKRRKKKYWSAQNTVAGKLLR